MANVPTGSTSSRGANIKKKFIQGASLLVLLCIAGAALYVYAMLSVSYSDGERSGILQ